jgi:hypothetical protein
VGWQAEHQRFLTDIERLPTEPGAQVQSASATDLCHPLQRVRGLRAQEAPTAAASPMRSRYGWNSIHGIAAHCGCRAEHQRFLTDIERLPTGNLAPARFSRGQLTDLVVIPLQRSAALRAQEVLTSLLHYPDAITRYGWNSPYGIRTVGWQGAEHQQFLTDRH